MSHVKLKGIVIKETATGDSDKIITIFTNTHGKIQASARGARRPKSRISVGTQLLCYCDFVLYGGSSMYSVNSCDVIMPFFEIRSDIILLTYAAHMIEIINDVIRDEQPSNKVLKLFLTSLYHLSKGKDAKLVKSVFELKLLALIGYMPEVRKCCVCGSNSMSDIYFGQKKSGFLCEKCKTLDKTSKQISLGTAKSIIYVLCSSNKELFDFNLSPRILNEFSEIVDKYLYEKLEKKYTKIDFLKSI